MLFLIFLFFNQLGYFNLAALVLALVVSDLAFFKMREVISIWGYYVTFWAVKAFEFLSIECSEHVAISFYKNNELRWAFVGAVFPFCAVSALFATEQLAWVAFDWIDDDSLTDLALVFELEFLPVHLHRFH